VPTAERPPRASVGKAFEAPSVWVPPLVLVAALVFVMTLVYFGSVVDPTGHLHGLPVGIVDDDAGASVGSQHVDFGAQLAAEFKHSPALTSRLSIRSGSLTSIEHRMDLDDEYAAVVIPPGFTASLLAAAGKSGPGSAATTRPTVELLTNPRAGTLAVSLATGVLQPALADASHRIGRELRAKATVPVSGASAMLLSDPVAVSAVTHRPLPRHTALGLSAFYISLLTIFCGFLGGTIVHVALDAVLGYAATEVGPRWSLRQPVAISRWYTLLAKWLLAVPFSLVLTGLMLFAAVVILDMNTPHFWELWLLAWYAAAVVAIGTLVLFAGLGTVGQLIALLIFVYLALASSGGTVPLQALSDPFRFLAEFEPLRQVLGGIRSILYFNARGAAGLTRAFVLTTIGLGFWLALGAAITNLYDRKGLNRLSPVLLGYIDEAVRRYQRESAGRTGGGDGAS
jgi:Protein of unknown function (DUF3533)